MASVIRHVIPHAGCVVCHDAEVAGATLWGARSQRCGRCLGGWVRHGMVSVHICCFQCVETALSNLPCLCAVAASSAVRGVCGRVQILRADLLRGSQVL